MLLALSSASLPDAMSQPYGASFSLQSVASLSASS